MKPVATLDLRIIFDEAVRVAKIMGELLKPSPPHSKFLEAQERGKFRGRPR